MAGLQETVQEGVSQKIDRIADCSMLTGIRN
jgi:hypothetical protein